MTQKSQEKETNFKLTLKVDPKDNDKGEMKHSIFIIYARFDSSSSNNDSYLNFTLKKSRIRYLLVFCFFEKGKMLMLNDKVFTYSAMCDEFYLSICILGRTVFSFFISAS